MAHLKTTFITEHNTAYPDQRGIINIIGTLPESKPYLSISFQHKGNQIAGGWIADKDLERFAVNILKSLKSKHLK